MVVGLVPVDASADTRCSQCRDLLVVGKSVGLSSDHDSPLDAMLKRQRAVEPDDIVTQDIFVDHCSNHASSLELGTINGSIWCIFGQNEKPNGRYKY